MTYEGAGQFVYSLTIEPPVTISCDKSFDESDLHGRLLMLEVEGGSRYYYRYQFPQFPFEVATIYIPTLLKIFQQYGSASIAEADRAALRRGLEKRRKEVAQMEETTNQILQLQKLIDVEQENVAARRDRRPSP